MKKFSENCFGLTEQIKVGTLTLVINYFASNTCHLYCSLFYRIQTSHLLTSNL